QRSGREGTSDFGLVRVSLTLIPQGRLCRPEEPFLRRQLAAESKNGFPADFPPASEGCRKI
ncbi:MAG: hypothetical protein IKE30_10455, partial [Clostridia bacterium]|nr:hypothetical protein [Clostridia bacterium]